MKKFGILALVIAASVLGVSPALAQYEGGTTVPPPTTNTTGTTNTTATTQAPGTTNTTQGGGGTTIPGSVTTLPAPGVTLPAGATGGTLGEDGATTLEFCGFAPGSPVGVTWNGTFVSTKTSNSSGCIQVVVVYVDDDDAGTAVGLDGVRLAAIRVPLRELAQATGATVRVDGRTLAGVIGNNTMTASGTGADGAPLTVTTSVRLLSQAESVAAGVPGATGTDGAGGGGLPRTGVMILRWSMVGLALLGVGALLVILDRRRTHA